MNTELSTYEQQAIEFLNAKNTEFSCKFLKHGKHFDDDKEERDIYEITLKRGEKSYSFNFGQSIVNSCKEISVSNDAEQIEVFAGLRTNKSSCSTKFFVYKSKDYGLNYEEIEAIAFDLEKQYCNALKPKNEFYLKKFESGEISRNAYLQKVGHANLEQGAFIQCVNRAIERDVNKTVQKWVELDAIDKKAPTAYDVLACLTKYDPGTFENFCSEFGYDTDSRKAEKTHIAVLDEWKNICMLYSDSEIEQLQEIQ